MGWCGTILRISFYTIATLCAVLLYFHLECLRDREERDRDMFNDVYIPDQTDCLAELPYVKPSVKEVISFFGLETILIQSLPCSVTKLIAFIKLDILGHTPNDPKKNPAYEFKNVTVLDARKHNPGTFDETGFTLIELDKLPETTDWRMGTQDAHHFYKQMEPYIKKLYPQTKKMMWLNNVVRGGTKPLDQPPAPIPHLDFNQNDEEREKFYKDLEFPRNPSNPEKNEAGHLVGEFDTPEMKHRVMLGLWKPLSPEKICDRPLMVMDRRTFKEENQVAHHVHVNLLFMYLNTFNGLLSYHPDQKWFYYSMQTTKEVLIFHQYTKGHWHVNPHGAFKNKNCPKDTEARMSAELRVSLYW